MRFLTTLILILLSYYSYSVEKVNITYYVIEDSAAPFQIVDGVKKKHSGIVSDILTAIDSEEINLSSKVLPFKRMIKEMNSKGSGAWMSYGSKVWSGPQSDVLSKNSLITIKHKILTLKKNPYNSIEDLFGKRIAFIRGFQYPGLERYVKDKSIDVIRFSSQEAAIRAVEIGRVYGFPEMEIRLKYMMKANKFDEDLFLYNDISKVIPNYEINFCFSKDFPKATIKKLDNKIQLLKKNGTIKSIIKSYTD